MSDAPPPPPAADPGPEVLPDERIEDDFDVPPPLAEAPVPAGRTLLAGGLMGTANLVPGVSGGTMVLVCGLYAHFVDAMAAVSKGRFARGPVTFLGLLFAAKFAAMGLLGGPVAQLVADHRAVAYSLFVGMTLAGTPVVWRIFRTAPPQTSEPKLAWGLVALGFVLMASLALLPLPPDEHEDGADYRPTHDIPTDAAAGAAAFGAMALPGVSGGTVKLAMGRYEPTVWALGQPLPWLGSLVGLGEGVPAGEWLPVLLPYALGAAAGLVIVSNLLKWLLKRYERAMAATLLGVLWGSVVPVAYVGFRAIWRTSGPADWALWAASAAVGFAAVYALTVWQQRAKRTAASH